MKNIFKGVLFSIICLNAHSYSGFSFRTMTGARVAYLPIAEKSVGALAGGALEYSIPMPGDGFISIEAAWPWYDKAFTRDTIWSNLLWGEISIPAYLLIFIPIWHLNFGVKFDDWIVTVGSFYIWGTHMSVRKHVTDNLLMELHWTWMIDRIIFEQGLDDMHFVFSLRWVI